MNYYYYKCHSEDEQIRFLTYLETTNDYYWRQEGERPTSYIPAHKTDLEIVIFYIHDKRIYYSEDLEDIESKYKPFPYEPNLYEF